MNEKSARSFSLHQPNIVLQNLELFLEEDKISRLDLYSGIVNEKKDILSFSA